MKSVNRLILLLFVSNSMYAQDEIPCWLSGDSSNVVTTQEAKLKTYLLPINLDDPQGDAKKRISHGDFRLIAIGGVGTGYPGLSIPSEGDVICDYGGRYIQGTTDVYESKPHSQLARLFFEYAKEYNLILINHHRNSPSNSLLTQ